MFDDRTVAVVDVNVLSRNAAEIKKRLSPATQLMSVVKADGYGHGIEKASLAFDQYTDWFAVATFQEAKQLRAAGIDKPILVLGYVPYSKIIEAYDLRLAVSGYSYDYLMKVNRICESNNIRLDMHLKLDTGFSRLGLNVRELPFEVIQQVYSLNSINFTGIYTHFPAVSEDLEFTKQQYKLFVRLCNSLSKSGINVGIRHCCNSKAMLYNPEMHMDMVRVGVYLYGLASPTDAEKLSVSLAITWKARLILVRALKKGEAVSYGRTFIANEDMKIGVLSVGFGDGYFRSLGNNTRTKVFINGAHVDILGKICMDYMMIDVSHVPDAVEGIYAEIVGKECTPYFLGKKVDSTAGEIIISINQRVKKIYIKGEK